MRIYNGTDSSVSLPLFGTQRIEISAHSVSGNVMGSTDFVKHISTSYRPDELLIIVSGPYELNLCAGVPSATEFVVQTLDEAILRFKKDEIKDEEPCDEDCKCNDEDCCGMEVAGPECDCCCPSPSTSAERIKSSAPSEKAMSAKAIRVERKK